MLGSAGRDRPDGGMKDECAEDVRLVEVKNVVDVRGRGTRMRHLISFFPVGTKQLVLLL